MFYNAHAFARWIGDWDTSSVTDFSWMFYMTGQGYVWPTIFVRDSYNSQNDGPPSAWSLKPGLCGENYYVSDGACVPCAAGTVNPRATVSTAATRRAPWTIGIGTARRTTASPPRRARRARADWLAPRATTCFKATRRAARFAPRTTARARGACVPCSEGNAARAGDDPSGGDTACTCSCKDRFRGNGMKLKDLAFFERSSRAYAEESRRGSRIREVRGDTRGEQPSETTSVHWSCDQI